MTALVTGAAGFIGSQMVDRLLEREDFVIGTDNLVRGKRKHLLDADRTGRFVFIEADLSNAEEMHQKLDPVLARRRVDAIWHMAANSDIAAGVADSSIDLRDTFMTTVNAIDIARRHGIPALAFASTSAIYGELPGALREESGPLFPISSYGAMKLAGEAALCAALGSFLGRGAIFRFPNVVGPRATHGVIFDLLNKLKKDAGTLEVLGDGRQCKPYMHTSELIDALLWIWDNADEKLACYMIAPWDDGATVAYIAEQVLKAAKRDSAKIRYTGGDRGWVGDVPSFRYCTEKLARLGWAPGLTSVAAVERACEEVARELGF